MLVYMVIWIVSGVIAYLTIGAAVAGVMERCDQYSSDPSERMFLIGLTILFWPLLVAAAGTFYTVAGIVTPFYFLAKGLAIKEQVKKEGE